MKKALMVIGLALCSTFAFAQTAKLPNLSGANLKAAVNNKAEMKPDYKASIFTKDGDDTIATFTFGPSEVANMTYGQAGAIVTANGNTVVDGNTVDFTHTQNVDACLWQYIPNVAYMSSDEFIEGYSYADYGDNHVNWYRGVITRMDTTYTGVDNGFMFCAMLEGNTMRNCHASFTLPGVQNHDSVAILDAAFLQAYRKFNSDVCYIDYKINGAWKSWEINVKAVDVEVNDYGPFRAVYTLPVELASQDSIFLRVRWKSNSRSGGAYGYFWAIDNFNIIGGGQDRWKRFSEYYLDGAYGTMPTGMKIPLTWYSSVANNGTNDRNDVQTIVTHIGATGAQNTVVSHSEANILGANNGGNPAEQHYISINERGFLNTFLTTDTANQTHQAWWGYSPYYGTTAVPANYHYLPADVLGGHGVTVSAVSPGADTIEYDTIRYEVVDISGEGDNVGYRWAHDNGIIPSKSAYTHGFNEEDGSYYLTDTGHYTEAGYTMALRYTTGSEIPTTEGEPWALLGIEIVPSTDPLDMDDMNDVEISPIAWTLAWSADGSEFDDLYEVPTGFSTVNNYMVDASVDANEDLYTGYRLPGEEYNAIKLNFPNQPLLQPNTSYYLGYRLRTEGFFAPAATRSGYYEGEDYTYYYENEETAPYYRQFWSSAWDLYLYDAGANYASIWMANSFNEFPMIRAIVGPRRDLTPYTVAALCSNEGNDTNYTVTNVAMRSFCGERDTVFEGASAVYYVLPLGDHGYIENLYIDGELVNLENSQEYNGGYVEEHDYKVYLDTVNEDGETVHQLDENGEPIPLLFRKYYTVTFEEINNNHTIKADAKWEPWHLGIDPVADESVLGVRPNPATSQVKVNISGVTGMVNCSIIDMSGRVVYNNDFNAEQVHMIDLSSFARGAYFVRVTNGTFSKIEKLIVR